MNLIGECIFMINNRNTLATENLYGGWKSYDLLVESGQEPSRSFVKRWDWHAWQFIVSLMPATGGFYFDFEV